MASKMCTDENHGAEIIVVRGITSILKQNQLGIQRRDICLELHIDRPLKISILDNCILNILQATLLANETFVEQNTMYHRFLFFKKVQQSA